MDRILAHAVIGAAITLSLLSMTAVDARAEGGRHSCGWKENPIKQGLEEELQFGLGGWFAVGTSSETDGRFRRLDDEITLDQAYACFERKADGAKGIDWGFRIDAMYGVDGREAQATGNNPGRWDYMNGFDHGEYSWALPQLYGEVAVGDLSVKAGHFYTIMGYEVVTAPDNFFYSHTYTMYNSEPFTHTGVLATYKASDAVTLYGGWTLGWDTGFDQRDGGSNFIGGISANITDRASVSFVTTFGDFGAEGEGYAHSLVLEVELTDRLRSVTQTNYMSVDNGASDIERASIAQYLFYAVNDQVQIGGRFEAFRQEIGGFTDEFYELTFGLNVMPLENLIVRPEVRFDLSDNNAGPSGDTIFGVDAILTY